MDKINLEQLVSKNQSIKIVPSLEDSLRDMGLNVDLDDNTKLWLYQLKITWKTWKKNATVESQIKMCFQSRPNPYRIALVFIVKCEDFKDCKPKSLPYFIIETLLKWSETSKEHPDESLKMPAFHIAVQQRNQHFLTLVVKTYHLTTMKNHILPLVKDMIKADNCKQASQVVIAMELFEDIPVEDLMFPLILQDRNTMIDEYLSECPSQVKPLLLFLDKLLDKNFNIREFVQNYIEENKICHVKYDKIYYKPLGKLVARLCNKFNIPIETCKNLSKNRTTGGLRYLIHQKYQEHNVSSSVWDDLVKDSLKQNAGSAQEFIDMLADYDKNEALKWANYLNIPEILLPLALQRTSLQEEPEQENWDTNIITQEYYQFSLPREQIVMIDTGEKFYDLVNSNLVKGNIVSIDCEWKPSFGATQSQVALIQIANVNNVYLIDTLLLNNQQYASFWYTFYKSFLDNAEIIKLGFGLEQDLKEMKASVVGLGHIKVKGEGLLDLCILWKSLLSNGLILPNNSDSGGQSLSSLVQSCFGYPLEKSEQCSNWELRPLRDTQVVYAALDAHVLVQIYEFLQKQCLEQGVNFEEICNDVMLESKKKSSKKPKVIDRIQASFSVFESKSVNDVKLLVEPMLSNIMSYLRYCGIDTSVIPSTMLWHDVVNLAISEDRIIVLSKIKYSPTANFPQHSILVVNKGTDLEQLCEILKSLNIDIKQHDLLSLCLCCNSNNLRRLNSEEVLQSCNEYQNSTASSDINDRYGSDDEDASYNNFLSDSDCDEDLNLHITKPVIVNKSCTTSKGVAIMINNVHKLSTSYKPAILCEECGMMFWDGDETLNSVIEIVFKIIKLKIW